MDKQELLNTLCAKEMELRDERIEIAKRLARVEVLQIEIDKIKRRVQMEEDDEE